MPRSGGISPLALIVHGGAGSRGPTEERAPRKRVMMEAVKAGAIVLRGGGSALDAVVASIVILEDNQLFNAGFGSTLNLDGDVEMDASVMVGGTSAPRAGAVAVISRMKNPIQLARAVMEKTSHVLMVGTGAERFARDAGFSLCAPEALISPRARERFKTYVERRAEVGFAQSEHGTVGAAALDIHGGLAAATSTGGVPGKMVGRVGDSAIIGAGTFANETAAASATGHGESIIMASLCRETIEAIGKPELTRLAQQKIAALIAPERSEAGLILVDRKGRIGYAHNAETMEVASFHSSHGFRHDWAAPMATARKSRT